MKLLMPESVPAGLTLDSDLSDVQVHTYDQEAPIPGEHRDADAVVAWMNPRERVVELAATMSHLRWVQCLGAGPESFLTAGFAPEVTITRGIGLHDVPVAEHCLALILAAARRLDLARDAQRVRRWATEITGNQLTTRTAFTQIDGARFVIWGLGGIGGTVARYLQALGGTVAAIGRSRGERAGVPIVELDSAAPVLAEADALIAVLPERENTVGIVDRRVLEAMPAGAWFINVGRGRTVVEDDLVAALRSGSIAGAALDVFAQEPLAPDSPLWLLENVILTPHSAGGRPTGVSALVNENLRRLSSGRSLLGVIS